MNAEHNAMLNIAESSFRCIAKGMKCMAYSAMRGSGFIIHDVQPARITGMLAYPKMVEVKGHDPETFEATSCETPVLLLTNFELSMARQSIRVTERRSDMAVIEDLLNGMDGVRCEVEAYAASIPEVFHGLLESYPNLDVRKLRIKDVINARDATLATANFALMEPSMRDELLTRYSDSIQGFSATLKTDMGKQTLSVNKNGSIRASEDIPPELIATLRALIREHHETIEVEIVTL